MSHGPRHLIIVGTVLLVAIGATIHLGRTEDIGWVLAIVIVVSHVSVITAVAAWIGRRIARRRERSSAQVREDSSA